MIRKTVLLAAVAALLPAAGASASTFKVTSDYGDKQVHYIGGAGENNKVTVSMQVWPVTNSHKVVIKDDSVSAIGVTSWNPLDGTCEPIANELICNGDVLPIIDAGDGDDTVTNTDSRVHVIVNGGAGADYASGPFVEFDGGPGPDTMAPGMSMTYGPGEPGDIDVTLDGVANDGHAGEGDNIPAASGVRVKASGDVTITGSSANDYLDRTGGVGATHIDGGGGNDEIISYADGSVLDGGPGNDQIYFEGAYTRSATVDGGSGDDTIGTTSGNDTITGGPGVDTINAGAGDDTIDLRDGEADYLTDCSMGNDTVFADPVDTALLDCEEVNR